MTTILLSVAYDGTAYAGAASQRNAVTVADTLHAALLKLDDSVSRLRLVSRTDAGVHARDQRIAFDTHRDLPLRAWVLGSIRHLPGDIVVRAAERVPDGFTPRFAALRKHYRYRLYGGQLADPFLRGRAWHVPGIQRALDDMQRALMALQGSHDFSAFSAAADQRKDRRCTLSQIRCQRLASVTDGVAIDVIGDRFLYNMVRIVVGSAVDVGRGRKPVEALAQALAQRDRKLAGVTAPPHGLYLEQVWLDVQPTERWPVASPAANPAECPTASPSSPAGTPADAEP